MTKNGAKLHPKQTIAWTSPATEILFGGAAGGGKSYLMRVMAIRYAMEVPNIQIYLFRRLSDDLKKNHLDGASGFIALLQDYVAKKLVKISYEKNRISFANGSKIVLASCQYESDKEKYQGLEIQLLLFDELTHFTANIYNFLRSRVRISGGLKIPDHLKDQLPRIFAASNPGGVGHSFVKKYFIDNKEPYKMYLQNQKNGGLLRQFIPAKLEDNPTLMKNDPFYSQRLEGLGGTLAKQMRDGDWSTIDGAYFDKFDNKKHVLEPFEIPHYWPKIMGFDWGYAKPFATLWATISEGVEIQGRWIPYGSIIFYREYYGCVEGKEDVGLKITNSEIAKKIKEINLNDNVETCVADPAIFANNGDLSIADQFRNEGILFLRGDNKRVPGWQQLRQRLTGTVKSEGLPLIYIFSTCKHFIRTLTDMQHDPHNSEDLNTKLEDHLADTSRYICMHRKLPVEHIEKNLEQFAFANVFPNAEL